MVSSGAALVLESGWLSRSLSSGGRFKLVNSDDDNNITSVVDKY